MGTPLPFAPFQYRAWCRKMSWSTGQLTDNDVVYDGDTAYLFMDKGERSYSDASCRLYGINAPEMTDQDPAIRTKAVAARDYLRSLIQNKEVFVQSLALDKYGRPIVIIWENAADFGDRSKSVNRKMIDAGHSILYLPTYGTLE